MKQRLNCVLLIDDDEATNFLNEMTIEEADCAQNVVAVQGGQEALAYLQAKQGDIYPQPDLIFLDINMPAMNGWEFLDEYRKLDKAMRGRIIVVMLTTSINPDDEEKSKTYEEVEDYLSKPLTREKLMEIIKANFPEKL